ncbi:MAG: extracellular solute-binding protein [Patescibacteria group bacterium]|nr:extracellular solute-binding protein [Patescibacteria group bacterium]
MKIFPLVVTGLFVLLAIGGFILFATFSAKGSSSSIGTVVIWGSVPPASMNALLEEIKKTTDIYNKVSYVQVPDAELSQKLVEAIASGSGPDLIILPEKDLISESTKLELIPYATISRRDFQDTFIQAGESFLAGNGSFGVPFSVDPLVMYWNRSLFADAGIAQPPTYWDEVADIAPRLTKATQNGTLQQSAVALGTWQNVTHAKEIFLTLLSQLGNPVITPNAQGGLSVTILDKPSAATVSPAESALRFYTEFADPTQSVYSWNSAQQPSHDAFTAGTLAIYFGYASELAQIRAANPNLNFDVALMPRIRGGGQGSYAAVSAFSIPRGSQNPSGAIAVAKAMTSASAQAVFANNANLPPIRRDTSPGKASDPYIVVFRNASLTAFAFLDPNPSATDVIFEHAVEAVTSGRLEVSAAVTTAAAELSALLGVQ